ncbi:MAG: DNA polymerase I [Rhodospirillales bacterium]|jgi:DNA polymerase-1|nr:DNA polymerase I [Rhodospirillales bacterium]HIJ45634.1 DNA polymerase I [Rhodospirillaceae bacterium]HIJ93850.1 DNA polymerase I [Rhodospirillaceae bacterium]HJP54948.1 DNA polymerase I [Rhodospirillales bacterium]
MSLNVSGDKDSATPRQVYLIDGSGFIFRAFHALPPMTRPDGTPVNAVYGFISMLLKLLDEADADYFAVIFDKKRRTFRNDIFPDYKANRPDPPEELIPQFELVRDAVAALNLVPVDMDGFEADDLIATYARLARDAGAEVTIVSSDKDLMQLVGPGVTMQDAMKNRAIGPEEVREKFGVGPEKVVDVQALAGDSSDNVPGVAGIGIKTAAKLIREYGDLDNLLARAGEIKQPKRRRNLIEQADVARLSRTLVTLKDDVPVEVPLADFAVKETDREALLKFLDEQGFKSLVGKVKSRFGREGPAAAESVAAAADYELVREAAALRRWIAAASEAGAVAVDTETTSLNAVEAKLVGVSLAAAAGRACYIPLAHRTPAAQGSLDLGDDLGGGGGEEAPRQIDFSDAMALLKPLLEDAAVLKVGHNIKYDMQVLAQHGVSIAPVDDTMVLSYVLEGGLHGHGLDELAERHLGHATIKYKDMVGSGKSQVTFDLVAIDKALDYAAEDADLTGILHRRLKPRLAAERMATVYETIERPLIPVLVEMERLGIKVDAAELKRLSDDFSTRLAGLEEEIHQLAGRQFNIGSPKQLGLVLFDEMGLAGGKKGKTGAYATGADVLEILAAEGHGLPARVLDWRQLAKLKNTYTDALVGQINEASQRVHTSYSMAATSTGRLASSNPNLQNIPVRTEEGRKIRRAFIAEKGCKLLSADYSQIELRLLAHVADITTMKQAFRDGQDIHAQTASQVFGVPVEGMDAALRRRAKAINFGIVYGISAFGLGRQLGISNRQAGRYIEAYFERYPGIQGYMDRTKEEAKSNGFVTTLFGRKCHVRGLNDKNPARRNFAERAAINAPIQGGAADIIKRAMIRLPGAIDEAGLGAKMLLQVHDELIFEVPEAEAEETAALVQKIMRRAAFLDVPLVVDTGLGDNWAQAH